MSRITNFFILASYALLAAFLGVAAFKFGELSQAFAAVVGLGVFLFFAQAHGVLARAQERRALEAELSNLHRNQRIVSEELERAQARMREMADVTEAKAAARNEDLIAEVRVIETLVKQMADGIEEKARKTMQRVAERMQGGEAPTEAAAARPKSVRYASDLKSIFDQLSEAELVSVIQGALKENRVDVYLQPIVSLPQRKVRYYEGLSRLRTDDGEVIEPQQYIQLAESTGLVPLIDNLLLFRCIQIVRRLARRQEDLAIFLNISIHSLQDQDFFPQFLDFMRINSDLSHLLIFEFGQDTVENCGPMEKANLRRLAELGFRFSMDKVRNLDLNLAELRDRRFRFIKVEPEVLLRALPQEEGAGASNLADQIPLESVNGVDVFEDIEILDDGTEVAIESADRETALSEAEDIVDIEQDAQMDQEASQGFFIHAADLKDLLNRYGMDLIAEKLESEAEVIEMIELDVDYGQGFVLGGPRPVRNSDVDDALPEFSRPVLTEENEVTETLVDGDRAAG